VGIENVSGQLSLLRVHERGGKFGPPADQIDVEVVVKFVHQPTRAYGFQLRSDANGPAREGMLGLLRDGFNHGWTVNMDFDIQPGHNNAIIIRVWLTKPPRVQPPGLGQTNAPGKAKSQTKTKPAKKAAKATKKRAARR
jgi:hypothetical protein